ncbi:MAG: aminotransferase class IV [Desulfobacterales bacterium]
MPELAYLNGKIVPINQATVPIEDRGYQFGDAVYEYIASYKGRMFCVREHLDRLERSMRALDFPSVHRDTVQDALTNLFDRAMLERAGIYIQISRGVAPRAHGFPQTTSVQMVMTIRNLPETHSYVNKGVSVITTKDLRWGRCDIKTVQLLPNVLAKQKALDKGVYDAIFVSDKGVVREATSSNLFFISGGKAVTHPLTHHILAGITRINILDICRQKKIGVEERFYRVEDLYGADEVFLTGTVTEVTPVVRVDGRAVGGGTVGVHTMELYKALREKATRHADEKHE